MAHSPDGPAGRLRALLLLWNLMRTLKARTAELLGLVENSTPAVPPCESNDYVNDGRKGHPITQAALKML